MLFIYLCFCVCVFCSSMFHTCLMSTHGKEEESVMTPYFNNENLNHPFTGTTLHTPLSKSTERFFSSLSIFPPSHEFFSLSVFPPSHRGVLAIPQYFLLLQIWLSSHKTHCRLYYLATLSLHKNIPRPPPTTQQPTNQNTTINHGEYDLIA